MKSVQLNPTPKQEFQESADHMKAHGALIDSPSFRRAVKVALAEHARMMCALAPSSMDSPNQLQASAMAFQRIQGANDVMNIMLKLSEIPKLPNKKDDSNLSHE
jgi:hypothetical protein